MYTGIPTDPRAAEALKELRLIRTKLKQGELNYDKSKLLAEPWLEQLNEVAVGVSRKNGHKHRKFYWSSFIR